MTSEWQTLTLREAGITLIDCDHRTPPSADTGYPYVAIPQLRNGRIELSGVRRITPEHFAEWTRKARPTANDVVLSRRCNPGETAFVPPDLNFALGQNLVLLRADGKRVYPPFLRWLVRGPKWWEQIGKNLNVGAVFDSLKCADVPNFELHIPPLAKQRAIAHILGTLDDKIELNQRMNGTLEAMARALFKSWFVDFDPVRANAEGRDPGLPKHIADLFPNSFEDSELGKIPKGWKAGRFGDVVEQLRDQENPLASPEALFYHYSLPSFDQGQSPNPEYGGSIKSLKLRVPAGAILLSKLNPEIERVWMVDVRPDERAVCSTEFLVLRAFSPFTRSYVYCLARSPFFRQQIEGLVTGTSKSHQRAQVASILNLAVVMPPSRLVAAFDNVATSRLARTLYCRREYRALAALRDTLLPKLISGKLRVKDAERFVESTG